MDLHPCSASTTQFCFWWVQLFSNMFYPNSYLIRSSFSDLSTMLICPLYPKFSSFERILLGGLFFFNKAEGTCNCRYWAQSWSWGCVLVASIPTYAHLRCCLSLSFQFAQGFIPVRAKSAKMEKDRWIACATRWSVSSCTQAERKRKKYRQEISLTSRCFFQKINHLSVQARHPFSFLME